MAQRYAISGVDQAQAYLRHPILWQRLRTCTEAVNAVTGCSAHEIFGTPDDVKSRSSMTLFGRVGPTHPELSTALAAYFGGKEDPQTLEKLAQPIDAFAGNPVKIGGLGRGNTRPKTVETRMFYGKERPKSGRRNTSDRNTRRLSGAAGRDRIASA